MLNNNPYGVRQKPTTVVKLAEAREAYEAQDFAPIPPVVAQAVERNPFESLRIPTK